MTIRAVLFDFDHTLVDSPLDFGAMRAGVLRILSAAGARLPADAEHRLVLELVAEACAGLPDGLAASTARRAEDHIRAVELAAAGQAAPIVGVAPALARLRADGRSVAIITRNARAVIEVVLERCPLPHDLLLCRDDVSAVKPDPRHALEALARLDVGPNEALLVGDFAADITCGVAAGVVAVGVTTGRQSAAELQAAGAVCVLPSAAVLPAYLAARGW